MLIRCDQVTRTSGAAEGTSGAWMRLLSFASTLSATFQSAACRGPSQSLRLDLRTSASQDASCYLGFVDLETARRQVAANLKDLRRAEALIHADPETMGGEPVFRGTRISVADMPGSDAPEDEPLSGYPALDSSKLLRLASIWAKAHPRQGRPRPSCRPLRPRHGRAGRRSRPHHRIHKGLRREVLFLSRRRVGARSRCLM